MKTDRNKNEEMGAARAVLASAEVAALEVLRETGVDVLEAVMERRDRRKRMVVDFRYICKRLMRRCKGLAKRRVRSITPQECAGYLRQAFDTPR